MRIVITGPESSGKTELALALSQAYKGMMIPEYARYYLKPLNPEYTIEDVMHIAEIQYKWSKSVHKEALIIEDTDLLTILIWIEFKYGYTDQRILSLLEKNLPNVYFFCEPDITWTPDPLRENEKDREIIGAQFIKYLQLFQVKYYFIHGLARSRLNLAKFYMNLIVK